jgi:hypothetical protein
MKRTVLHDSTSVTTFLGRGGKANMPNVTMSLPFRVESTVYAWAGIENPVSTGTELKVLWSAAGNSATIPYPDPAALDLIHRLSVEFESGNDARVLTSMTLALFDSNGQIKSIKDLVEWVLDSPRP